MSEAVEQVRWGRRMLLVAFGVGALWLVGLLGHGNSAHADSLVPRSTMQLVAHPVAGVNLNASGPVPPLIRPVPTLDTQAHAALPHRMPRAQIGRPIAREAGRPVVGFVRAAVGKTIRPIAQTVVEPVLTGTVRPVLTGVVWPVVSKVVRPVVTGVHLVPVSPVLPVDGPTAPVLGSVGPVLGSVGPVSAAGNSGSPQTVTSGVGGIAGQPVWVSTGASGRATSSQAAVRSASASSGVLRTSLAGAIAHRPAPHPRPAPSPQPVPAALASSTSAGPAQQSRTVTDLTATHHAENVMPGRALAAGSSAIAPREQAFSPSVSPD